MDDMSICITWTRDDTDGMVWKQRDTYNLTNMNPIKKVVSCRNVSEFYLRDDQFESQWDTDYPK